MNKLTPEERAEIPYIDRNVDTSFRIYKKNHPNDPQPYDHALFPTRPEDAPGESSTPATWSQSS